MLHDSYIYFTGTEKSRCVALGIKNQTESLNLAFLFGKTRKTIGKLSVLNYYKTLIIWPKAFHNEYGYATAAVAAVNHTTDIFTAVLRKPLTFTALERVANLWDKGHQFGPTELLIFRLLVFGESVNYVPRKF